MEFILVILCFADGYKLEARIADNEEEAYHNDFRSEKPKSSTKNISWQLAVPHTKNQIAAQTHLKSFNPLYLNKKTKIGDHSTLEINYDF